MKSAMMGAGMGIICLLLICTGVGAEQSGDTLVAQADSTQELTGLPEDLDKAEIPPLPFSFEGLASGNSLVNGTGNLTKLVEVNASAGGYVFGLLQVVGTDNTHWEYEEVIMNTSDMSYAGGLLFVENADKILFEGHAITPDDLVAYAGVGLVDEKWKDAGPYSGQVAVITGIIQGDANAWIEARNEQGTITHLTRAYHVIPCANTSSESHTPPGLEWNPDEDSTGISAHQPFCYDEYAGSFTNYEAGSTNGAFSYAICTPYQAYSTHFQDVKKIGFLQTNTMAAEWPAKNVGSQGRGVLEEVKVINGTSVSHQGQAIFSAGGIRAGGDTQATADSYIGVRVFPEGDETEPSWRLGYADTEVTGAATRRGDSGQVTVPASYDGWAEGIIRKGVYQTKERYTAKGAEISRTTAGGVFVNRQNPVTGVMANITAGNAANPRGTSGISGMAVLEVDGTADNATTLDGRWIVSSPQEIPITRWIEAVKPGSPAYSTTSTSTGTKNVKESAYYRSGTVNVIP
jgi:hypothetical protein